MWSVPAALASGSDGRSCMIADVESVFESTVKSLCAERGLTVRLLPASRWHRSAMTNVRRGTIQPGRVEFQGSPADQEWSAAHEVAHLGLGHRRWTSKVAAAGLGFAAVGLAGLVLVLARAVATDVPASVPVFLVCVGALAAGFVLVVWGRARSAVVDREQELQADRLAHQWGYPLTRDRADRLARVEGGRPRWSRWRSHPMPYDRITG